MGNLIISGSGKEHKINVILRIVIALLIGVAVTVVAMFNISPTPEEIIGTAKGSRRVYIIGGVLLLYLCIFCCIYVWLHILKTEINVYENEIRGKSMDANFFVDFFSLFSFRIDNATVKMSEFHVDYDQIFSVKYMGKSVIIRTASKNHKCYAMNAKEIRDVIVKQKNENNM